MNTQESGDEYFFWHSKAGWKWGLETDEINFFAVGPFATFDEATSAFFAEPPASLAVMVATRALIKNQRG